MRDIINYLFGVEGENIVVTFFGYNIEKWHDEYNDEIIQILNREIGQDNAEVLICNLNGLETTALCCCSIYKSTHPNMKLIFIPITNDIPPYFYEFFDTMFYPSFENKSKEYIIKYRNNYIIDKCDIFITNVDNSNSSVFKMYQYAKSLNKTVYNLADSFCFTKSSALLTKEQKAITFEAVWNYNSEISHPSYFIRRIFSYLKEHKDLINDPDYYRLYQETLDFQIRVMVKDTGWDPGNIQKHRKCVEHLTDLFNSHPRNKSTKFTIDQIDDFLKYRKTIWNS